ncbi:MAG: YceH family protein [Acidimicrobiia bacterium]
MELSAEAARVLGCLVEKARTTPDQYPLSLNALVGACNQTTNRWPVVRYGEGTVENALDELRTLELVRREKPHGGRAIKYSELLGRALRLDEPAIAVLGVLLLRGPQTPGELKARTERLHEFADLDAVDQTLRALAEHEDGPLVEQLPREPGRKESRWRDCWQSDAAQSGSARSEGVAPTGATDGVAQVTQPDLAGRVAALEAEVARLRAVVEGMPRDGSH